MSLEGTVSATEQEMLNELKGKIFAIPKADDTLTKSGYSADAKATGDALGKKVNTEDIVNNLETDATDKPLSAAQGKALKKYMDEVDGSIAQNVSYDNAESGLEAVDVQSAIDEVKEKSYPKSGGMIEGPVHTRNVDNGYSTLNKNHSMDADYGTQVVDRTADGKVAHLTVGAMYNTLSFTDTENHVNNVHHEGNKPFGNYTGNGSADARTVEIKGIGRLLLMYNANYVAFVTPEGAILIQREGAALSWVPGAEVYFLNNLFLNTSHEAFNAADANYYYQVI